MQSSKPKLTPHRLAAANPEVKELIQKLKRIWKHASPEAKRKAVTELLEKGCSIRGLAEDTGIRDPTIRLALKVKPAASKPARKTPHRVPSKTDARAKKPASDQEKTQLLYICRKEPMPPMRRKRPCIKRRLSQSSKLTDR